MPENQDYKQSQEQLTSAFSGELNVTDLQVLSDQELDMMAGGRSFINGTIGLPSHGDKHHCFHHFPRHGNCEEAKSY